MLPVCSSSSCQIPVNGGLRSLCSPSRDVDSRICVLFGSSNEKILNKASFRMQAMRFSGGEIENSIDRSARFMQISELPVSEEGSIDFAEQSVDSLTMLPDVVEIEGITTVDLAPGSSSDEMKTSVEDVISGFGDSLNSSIENGQTTLTSLLDSVNSSFASVIKSASEAVDNVTGKLSSSVDQIGDAAGNKLNNVSSDFRGVAGKAGAFGIDALRSTIVALEDSLAKGASLVVYSYTSAKDLLPPEIKETLNLSEAKTAEILKPVGVLSQQVAFAIEGLEKNLGLDPSDPIVSFVLFFGTASSLWAFYWVKTYSGYAGDLSPDMTLQLLMGKENVVLVDVRPEILREADGIPDLRRSARYRYSSVSLPEVDASLRKLLKSGRDVEDGLVAAIIRNLKIVKDRSKVIVMDADGTRSKGIARSLRKLGVKRPYLVDGGFRSWVSQGLRIKELKPETAFSVLNEEAEAILEEINPSPWQVLAAGVGLVVASYALVEWEKTLQIVGVFGLGQTIFRRIASYQEPEDFRQDLRQLLIPVKLSSQAFSWAAGKLETNGIGLPTSPSSLDVQNRVLKAAALHESQPSEDKGTRELSTESVSPPSEQGELSEA